MAARRSPPAVPTRTRHEQDYMRPSRARIARNLRRSRSRPANRTQRNRRKPRPLNPRRWRVTFRIVCLQASILGAFACAALSLSAADAARPRMDLNGPWQFRLDPDKAGVAERWFAKPEERFPDRIKCPALGRPRDSERRPPVCGTILRAAGGTAARSKSPRTGGKRRSSCASAAPTVSRLCS